MKSSGEGEVAAVGERRDDQTSGVAEVLEAVRELCIDCAYVEEISHPVVPVRCRTAAAADPTVNITTTTITTTTTTALVAVW